MTLNVAFSVLSSDPNLNSRATGQVLLDSPGEMNVPVFSECTDGSHTNHFHLPSSLHLFLLPKGFLASQLHSVGTNVKSNPKLGPLLVT